MQAVLVVIIVAIITGVLGLLVGLFPAFLPDSQVIQLLDSGIAFLITFFDMARWFVPFDVFVLCFGAMLTVDHFALLSKLVQYLVGLVRG